MTNTIPDTKKCTSCKEEYPKSDQYFRYSNKRKRYLSSWCINCYKEYNQQSAVKRRKREKTAEWKKLNPDKVKSQLCRYYQRVKRRKRVRKETA